MSSQVWKSASSRATISIRMLACDKTTELGALTGKDARLVGVEVPGVEAAGHHVALAVQLRHPERVDDVTAGATDHDLGVDRDHHLTAGDDRSGLTGRGEAADVAFGVDRVVVLPPPLLTGDVDDAVGVVGVVERDHAGHRGHGDTGQHQRRDGDEHVLDQGVAVALLGDRLATISELDDDVGDHGEHDHTDDAGDQEDRPLQVVDVLGVLALGRPRVLRGIAGARRQHCSGAGTECRCAKA